MNSPTFIANQGKDKFKWKVYIGASFLEPATKCEYCVGGRIHGMMMYNDDDNICDKCNGRGVKSRWEPLWREQRIVDFLQNQLDNYLNNPEFLWEGAGI